MAVTPIQAHCRRCREPFHLFELVDDRTGRCPRCGWTLSPDWTSELVRQAHDADIIQRRLVAALRGIRNIPGNVMLRPHTVLRNLFEEVGWERDLAEDPAALRAELGALHRLLDQWDQLAAEPTSPPRRGLLRRLRDARRDRRANAEHEPSDPTRPPAPDTLGARRDGPAHEDSRPVAA